MAANSDLAKLTDKLVGTYHAPQAANERLAYAQQHYHLVSPATSVGALPEGCGVAMTLVQVDPDAETYDVGGGKCGLSKSALDRIAASLGLSWDPQASGRLDDGSDPRYCRYRVVGRYRAFDGQTQVVQGEKEMDLRPGSPQVEALEARARAKKRSAEPQIREMRLHILAHAETKARLRAIRSMGIRTAYTREELERPFMAARIMFTGQTKDPELKREFARMNAASFMGSGQTLYGVTPSGVHAQLPARIAPPPVGAVPVEEDDYLEPPPIQATQPGPSSPPAQQATPRPPSSSTLTIPGGKEKGVPLAKASDDSLRYWSDRIGVALDEGTSRSPERDEALVAAMTAELEQRAGKALAAESAEAVFPDDSEYR